jgi:hypothetical protein
MEWPFTIATTEKCKDKTSTVSAFSKRRISVTLTFHRNNEHVVNIVELMSLKKSNRVNAVIFVFPHLLKMFPVTNYIAGMFEHNFTAVLSVVVPFIACTRHNNVFLFCCQENVISYF